MTQETGGLYAADGVNVSAGDRFSEFAAGKSRETWGASPFVRVSDLSNGSFRGPRSIYFVGLPQDTTFTAAADGIGTKVGLITPAGFYTYAARDLVAMTCGDITRYGGIPLTFSSVLDVSTLGEPGSKTFQAFEQLLSGARDAALNQDVVLQTGETAELGTFVGSEDPDAVVKFNWAGFAFGAYHPKAMITGEHLAPGQTIIALREFGFRSNGISMVRKAFRLKYGPEWWNHLAAANDIRAAAQPSTLYDRFLVEANGWKSGAFKNRIPVTCLAHITGGGIPGKFGEDLLFRAGLSAKLDGLYEPPSIMKRCAEYRGLEGEAVDAETFYRTWNGGQGVLAVMDSEDVERFLDLAQDFGIAAKVCGQIFKADSPVLQIESPYHGETVEFHPQ